MELPWSRRSKEAYATLFYPNYTEQQCREVQAQQRASLPKFSGTGCFVVMQPYWRSCGQTDQWNTKKAIQYFSSGQVGGQAGALNSSFCTDRCYPMERAADATYVVNATGFLSVLEAEASLNFRLHATLAMSTSHSKLDVVGINTGWQPRQGFKLTTDMRPIEETFRAAACGDGFEVAPLGWEESLQGWSIQIKDPSAFLNALSLDLMVFSKDLECSVVEVQAANATLKPIATGGGVCKYYPMVEVCEDGWMPTSSFRLPLEPVRKYIQDDKKQSTFNVQAVTACTSLIGMEDQSNSKMDIFFSVRGSDIRLFPYVPGHVLEWKFTPCTFYPGKNKYKCILTFPRSEWNAVRTDGFKSEFFLTAMLDDNCSVRWPTQGGKPPTVEELCGQADFGETKLCGGTRESTTWRLPMAKVDDYARYGMYGDQHKFQCRLSCTGLPDDSDLVIEMKSVGWR